MDFPFPPPIFSGVFFPYGNLGSYYVLIWLVEKLALEFGGYCFVVALIPCTGFINLQESSIMVCNERHLGDLWTATFKFPALSY